TRLPRRRRAGAVLMLARQRRSDAQELLAGRPRPHGRERKDFRDLRVLFGDLRIRTRRRRREAELMLARFRSFPRKRESRSRKHWVPAFAGTSGLIYFVLLSVAAFAQSCPAPLSSARKLLLVVADDFTTTQATAQLFQRGSTGEPWR